MAKMEVKISSNFLGIQKMKNLMKKPKCRKIEFRPITFKLRILKHFKKIFRWEMKAT